MKRLAVGVLATQLEEILEMVRRQRHRVGKSTGEVIVGHSRAFSIGLPVLDGSIEDLIDDILGQLLTELILHVDKHLRAVEGAERGKLPLKALLLIHLIGKADIDPKSEPSLGGEGILLDRLRREVVADNLSLDAQIAVRRDVTEARLPLEAILKILREALSEGG